MISIIFLPVLSKNAFLRQIFGPLSPELLPFKSTYTVEFRKQCIFFPMKIFLC